MAVLRKSDSMSCTRVCSFSSLEVAIRTLSQVTDLKLFNGPIAETTSVSSMNVCVTGMRSLDRRYRL